ncbi:MAG: pyridine nucleotide-disulfide oxidoreductase [Spirochaetae bacterium HGW-Spirochaetae-3]|jgi:NADPH-dependent glutamate synthase beta subunit-like oxidoreductase|nr:MAG: pyridine nucleotide-disulfide oxidoreductase [Spirochaetae bacterium HGW-Spirochaetae-3]
MAARKCIVRLAKKICGATAMMVKIDEDAPEYYVLDCVVTDAMAEVGLAMELREPQTVEQIAGRCGKPVDETRELAIKLAEVGACVFSSENGVDLYELTVFVPGVMEKVVSNKELCEKYPQIPKAFEEYARLRGGMLSAKMPMGYGPMRVIPIQSAIEGDTHSAGYEEISSILDKNTLFAVADCSCRRSRRLLGEGCGHLEKDICIQLGKGAEYYIRTGKAREITREEADAIIKKAEENGLMHNIPNIDNGETHAICNCCGCGCYATRNSAMFNAPDMTRSNYVAVVDASKCVACGQCVENCPINAVKLGQKLCSLDPVAEEKTLSPRDHVWTKKHWNEDYRINRENVAASGTSPCKTTCPAHIAVQGYIKLASRGRYTDALELIKKENPFPAVCGRICPHDCESECTRGGIDSPVAIDEIKKFIADRELDAENRFIPAKRHEYDKKIAVIGSGPAGLSCAYFLAVDGYRVTVFEKRERLGGMLALGIPSFRLEKDVLDAEIDILRELGVEFRTGTEVGGSVSLDELRGQGFEAFYLAIGAQGGRSLGIEGEDADGALAGVDFLREVNLGRKTGLSGNVIVIGGGNVAIDVARTAIREGAGKTSMFSLESRAEMPALAEEIEEALEEKIEIDNGWGPKRIVTEDGRVTGVEFRKCASVFDGQGRFDPRYDETVTKIVPADHVLIAVGQAILWDRLLDGSRVELNRNATAKADDFTYQTAEPDVFVGGDAFTGPKFAINAIAAGKQASISIHRFVWEGQSLVYGRVRSAYRALDKANVVMEGYDETPRQRPTALSVGKTTYADKRATFTEEQLKKETERCLGCGTAVVDAEMCLGCGQCTTKCKLEAITLERVSDVVGTTFERLPLKLAPYAMKRVAKIAARSFMEVFSGKA